MNFLKKNYKVLLSILSFLIILYILPNFIDLSNRRSYFEKKIEETLKLKVSINGKISFAILPRPSLILNQVQIKSNYDDQKVNVLVNAPKIFINTGISNFLSKNFTINKIGIMDATFYADIYKSLGYENLDNFLNGKTFKQISIRNGRIILDNDFIHNINLTFKSRLDGKVRGKGNFIFKDGLVDDLSIVFSYLNKENYNIVSDFAYIIGKNKLKNNFTFIVKDNEKTFSGDSNLITNNISNFVKVFNKDYDLPTTPFFKEKLNIKASFQNSADALLVNNGSIEGNNVVASFKGKIPFLTDGNFGIDYKNILLNLDFSNLVLNRIFVVKKDIAQNPLLSIGDAKNLINLFQYVNANISAKSIILNNYVISDFSLTTTPIFLENNFDGINIKNLDYKIAKNKFSLSGKISNIKDDLTLDVSVNTNIPFTVSNIFGIRLKVTKFISKVLASSNLLKLDNFDITLANNDIFGSFMSLEKDGKTTYTANIKSDSINLDSIFRANIDLQFIISKLSSLGNNTLNLVSSFKRFKMNNKNYELLKLNSNFKDGSLNIKNLTFKDADYSSQMKGDLIDIVGDNGKFKNFQYKISSPLLKGLTLPFIRNTFIEKIIANGVNQINILLNGEAKNPVSSVDASLGNISVKVNGKLLDSNSDYKIELSHNELKGFLFSWGYIEENLMNYFYDNIPFSVTADVKGNNIDNIKLKIKDNYITGYITKENVKKDVITSVVFNSDKLNVKGVIKRIRETDGYVDLILKLIRLIPYNLSISSNVLDDYDGNSYQDFILNIKNVQNPGSIKLSLKKGDYSIDINSEIINSNNFEGNIDITNFFIPKNLMNNDVLKLISGILDAKISFKTFGTTAYQLLSNLNGNFDVSISKGVIDGISDYNTMFANILNLANITTNNVIYSLEASLKSGMLNFSNLNIKGKVSDANVENAAFELFAPNITASGMLSGNLIQKSINIESMFDISNLSPNNLVLMYNLKGYVNNLTGKIDTSPLISKISTVYLQKKKKELR